MVVKNNTCIGENIKQGPKGGIVDKIRFTFEFRLILSTNEQKIVYLSNKFYPKTEVTYVSPRGI